MKIAFNMSVSTLKASYGENEVHDLEDKLAKGFLTAPEGRTPAARIATAKDIAESDRLKARTVTP